MQLDTTGMSPEFTNVILPFPLLFNYCLLVLFVTHFAFTTNAFTTLYYYSPLILIMVKGYSCSNL